MWLVQFFVAVLKYVLAALVIDHLIINRVLSGGGFASTGSFWYTSLVMVLLWAIFNFEFTVTRSTK